MNKLLSRAMYLLARRDYSEYELRRKLATPPAFPSKSKRNKLSNRFNNQKDENISSDFLPQNESHSNTIDEHDIDAVIQYCYEHHWLNDAKFTASFIRTYANKGYGPKRIQLELQKRGLSKALITSSFIECEIDWAELTHQALIKHFKPPIFPDRKSKSKAINYLMYKGFHFEDIQDVLKSNSD